jgi:arginine-tRNA-protein transferase
MEESIVGERAGGFGADAVLAEGGEPCPYGKVAQQTLRYFATARCDAVEYTSALADGWRRSGFLFYRNECAGGCTGCVPIRVDAERLGANKTQRRICRLNGDLSLSAGAMEFREEDYALFSRYLRARHPEDAGDFDREAYVRGYLCSPVESLILRYRNPSGALLALSFVDVLADGLSSVYFAFEPDESRLSLGVYSVFAECALLKGLGLRWYYLGFYVDGCRKMEYKARYEPHELASGGLWREAGTGGATAARDEIG